MTFELKRLLLRYYPPGILLEYVSGKLASNEEICETKSIDLLDLSIYSDVEAVAEDILLLEPIIPRSQRENLKKMIIKLQDSIRPKSWSDLGLKFRIQSHVLPITNCTFDKSGECFATASYDRTVKIWNSQGREMIKLVGHRETVFCLAFNLPFSDKLATGSFDGGARVWGVESGKTISQFGSQNGSEIWSIAFSPDSEMIATGYADHRIDVWDTMNGIQLMKLESHSGEVVSVQFSNYDKLLVSASFDGSAKVWDMRMCRELHSFQAHGREVSTASFNYAADLVLTSSFDQSCRIWDVKTGNCIKVFTDCESLIMDASFNLVGNKIVAACFDGTSRIYDIESGACEHLLQCPDDQRIIKATFDPSGDRVCSVSETGICSIFNSQTGKLLQRFQDDKDRIFTAMFNYEGEFFMTGGENGTISLFKSSFQ